MEIESLLSTPERRKLIKFILFHPSEEIKINSLAKKAGVSPPLTSKVIFALRKRAWVNKKLNLNNPEVRALKIYFNILLLSRFIPTIRKKVEEVKGIGVYGSWAKGENNENSDLDLWVIMKKKQKPFALVKLMKEMEKKLKTEVNIIDLTEGKIKQLKKEDKPFYSSLFDSFVLWGEGVW